jgi:hypothetical protein
MIALTLVAALLAVLLVGAVTFTLVGLHRRKQQRAGVPPKNEPRAGL